ncbi:17551_t:CDS:10 [Dentiscutata erythropus]|uniref:17551_t:CDS:1 n=1 Tax=Dentiscutata erythropus TaxID=1348616 RepID=A0A9N9NC17_9GLOM|nr:17551_t:CDS:10 [Dentiscutata erythropus]
MPPTRRQTARTSHPRGRGALRRLMDPSASTNTNTSNTDTPANTIPSSLSPVSQQDPDLSAWAATQVSGQVKLCTIHSVVDLKTENGEEFAFITYTDQSLEPEWEPVKNLRNAEALIERCRQRQNSALKSVKFSTDLTNTREFLKSDTVPLTMRTSNPVQLDPKPKPILKAVQKAAADEPDTMQIDECDVLTEIKQWKGPLTKGKNSKFISNIVIKQISESYKDEHIFDILKDMNQMCMVNVIPSSFALQFVIKDVVLQGILSMESDKNSRSCDQFGVEHEWLKANDLRMLLIPYNIPEKQKNCMDLSKQLVLGIEKMDDIDHFMGEVMLQAEALGGKYFPIDAIGDETLDLVLVEVFWLNQLNFMPNLIRLKHMKRCQFLVYGYDIKRLQPIKFEPFFAPGGLLAVSTKVITADSQSVERIFGTAQINSGKWSILLNPKMKSHFDKIMDKNYGVFNAKFKSGEINFFEKDLWKKSQQRHGKNEVGSLYWTLLIFYRTLMVNGNPPRHCILIIHEDEVQLSRSQIPGVNI